MHPAPKSALIRTAALALALGGCELGSGAATGVPGPDELPTDPASSWVGTFRGGGVGTAGSESLQWEEVALRIRLEADSTAEEGCDPCLVLSLDTLFQAMQVRAPSNVELTVVREEEDRRETLQLLRYSGGGGTANVVDATLRIEEGSATILEASFLLDR